MGTDAPTLGVRTALGPSRRLAAVSIALALPLATGCAANFGAQTNQPYQPADGVTDRSGGVYAVNTLIVTDGQGNGTLVTALINQADQADSVQSMSAVDEVGRPLQLANLAQSEIALPPDTAVQLADEGQVRLSAETMEPGSYVDLTIQFAQAAPVDLEVPIVAIGTDYGDVPVGPIPAAGPS